MGKRTVITIDGLAGTGKSTLADGLAAKIGFKVLHSGLLYRAAAALVSDISDENVCAAIIKKVQLDTKAANLHSDEIAQKASKIATFPAIRVVLVEQQRDFESGHDLVAEGRDMGTVIFPEAECKFFIVVAPEIRAKRRVAQYGGSYETVFADILERDKRDSERKIAPTVPAIEALLVDNGDDVTLTEVLDHMYHLAVSRGVGKAP